MTKIKPLKVTYDIPSTENKHPPEGRVITLEFDKFFLVAVYVPNSRAKLVRLDYRINQWDKDFQQYTESLRAEGKPVYIHIYIYI